MAKLTLSDPTTLQNIVATIVANNAAVEAAMEITLSRDGTVPNAMEADLDMNSHRILNLPEALSDTEPVRLGDVPDIAPRFFIQDSQPATDEPEGSVWVDTLSHDNNVYLLDNHVWVFTGLELRGEPGVSGVIRIGNSEITNGTTTRVLFDNAGVFGEYAISGTGNVAMTTSPTLVTPALGTPSSVDLTNATNLPLSGIPSLAAGMATFLTTPTSANLIATVTNETGTGSLVFATNPVLVTPNLGTPSAAVLTNATGLPIAGITGLAAGIGTFLATPSSANLITAVTDETGTGSLVFATNPVLVTPNLGTPSAATLTNATGLPIAGITGLGAGIATFLATPSSANLATAVTDETGSGLLVFATTPTFTTNITVPLVIGGTGAASTLTLKSTSGSGTTDAIIFQVGSNGAVEAARFNTAGLATFGGASVSPTTNGGSALGTTALGWSNLFLNTGAVINYNNGDVTLTHATNKLTWAGADSGYIFSDSYGVVGHTAAVSSNGSGNIAGFQVHSPFQNTSQLTAAFFQWSADTSGPQFNFLKSRNATKGTHTIVNQDDQFGFLMFRGSDGTNFIQGAYVAAFCDGTPGTNDMPTRMEFATTADGASSPTVRMKMFSTGFTNITGGSFGRAAPVTKTGNFTLADTENWLIVNQAGTTTVTLPAASAYSGREVSFKTIQAQTLVSNASNVVPRAGGAAGTAMLAAAAGNWCTIVSDGTNWILMAGSP